MQVWAGMAICAHHATLIYNDTPGNAASRFICNANSPPDHANTAQQWDREGANCVEVASSNMRAYNWRTRSVCVKNHLHITSTVSVSWWNIISWNTCSVHARYFLHLFIFAVHFLSVCLSRSLCQTLLCTLCTLTCIHSSATWLFPSKNAVQENKQSWKIIVIMQVCFAWNCFKTCLFIQILFPVVSEKKKNLLDY